MFLFFVKRDNETLLERHLQFRSNVQRKSRDHCRYQCIYHRKCTDDRDANKEKSVERIDGHGHM